MARVKFINAAITAVPTDAGPALYFVATDNEGQVWWLDSEKAEPQWVRLPPHPGRPTSGEGP